ncbi:MAG: IPTL-CTERM sorting domain-containing protein [Acidobacteriota bacterium]
MQRFKTLNSRGLGWLVALSLCTAPAATAQVPEPVPLINPSFEDNVVDTPGSFTPEVDGWVMATNSGKGTYRPDATDFNEPVPDGINVAYINLGPNSLLQETGELLEAGATYTLTVQVGNRTDAGVADYQITLEAEGDVLATGTNPPTPDGGFVTSTTVYEATADQAGRPLTIRMNSLATQGLVQVNFDDVQLVKLSPVTPVTEVPTLSTFSLALLALLILGGGIFIRRRG